MNYDCIPEDHVQFSSDIVKINRKNDSQFRKIVIAGSKIYNLKEETVKRAIQASMVQGLVMSKTSYQFVIRVKGGYDYRFQSTIRWRIYEQVLKMSEVMGKSKVDLYLVEQFSLDVYSRRSSAVQKTLPPAIDFQFDNSLNKLISNLMQTDHRVLLISDPHLYEIRPKEITQVLKMGPYTSLVQFDQTKQKFIRKIIPKTGLALSHNEMRNRLADYKQNVRKEEIKFILQNPDQFLILSHCYRHNLADDVDNFKEFDQQTIKSIVRQVLTVIIMDDLKEIHLENILYDDILKVVHSQFQQIRPKRSTQETECPEDNLECILWSLGNFIYRLTYGIPPLIVNKKTCYSEQIYCRNSKQLNSLIDSLLEFQHKQRLKGYLSAKGSPALGILSHPWLQ